MKRLQFGLLVALALLAGAELFCFPPSAPAWPLLMVWLLGVVAAEKAARPTPYFGSFQLHLAWALICWGSLEQPARLFLPALLGLFALLALRRPRWELLADALAALMVVPMWQCMHWLAPSQARELVCWGLIGASVLTLQTYLGRQLARQSSRYSQWLRLELTLTPLRWAAWWTGCVSLWLSGPDYLRLLWLPGLLGLYWGAQNAVFRLQAEESQRALQRFTQTQDELRRALWERDQLHSSAQETSQLQLLQQRLAYLQDLNQLGPLLGEWLGSSLQLRSAALYIGELECVWVSSPETSRLETVSLWLPRAGSLDCLPQVLSAPWLSCETQALLLPLEGCWLYLGRLQPPWQAAEFQHLSRVLELVRPWLRGLLSSWVQQRHLQQVQLHSHSLRQQLDSLGYLLHCAQRLLQPLDLQQLWQELLACFNLTFQVQAAGLIEEGQAVVSWGIEPGPQLLSWAQGLSGVGYLAWPDRERWPVPWPEADNVITLPLAPRQLLLLAFSGQDLATPQQLQVLQGLGQLFGSSLGRARLYHQLESSRELWLQAQKTLALAQLSAGVAHELNSPLGAVQLALEAALRQQPELPKLHSALQACGRAQAVIDRLRLLASQQEQEGGSHDLVQILRRLVDQLPELAGRALWEGPPSLIVQADRAEVERALLPVLVNALEAGGQVSLSWGLQDGLAYVAIQDGGPGFSPEVRSRLGEAFFTTKVIGKNKGLGLASVDQACRRLGGRWEVESRPKVEGARVTIRIPLLQPVLPAAKS